MVDSTQTKAAEINDLFAPYTNQEAKYVALINFGKKLPAMEASDKNDTTMVRGCQCNFWMISGPKETGSDLIVIQADSDAAIMKGLIAILWYLFSDQPAVNLIAFDIPSFFEKLGFLDFLTITRRTGMFSIIIQLRNSAHNVIEQADQKEIFP